MLGEILGDRGRPVRLQIARCAHHDIAPRAPQRERDHVGGHKVGAADAEVEAAGDNIHRRPSVTMSMWTWGCARRNGRTSQEKISRAAVGKALMRSVPEGVAC